jgi:hypothetical protein
VSQQIAEEASGVFRLLLGPLQLCAEFGYLPLGLIDRVLLDERCLREDVQGVWIAPDVLPYELLGLLILILHLGAVYPLGKALQHLLFLSCHPSPLAHPIVGGLPAACKRGNAGVSQ